MNKQITGKLVSVFLLFVFLLLVAGKSHAQHYPVQCNVQVIPPYSVHLADYYQGSNQKLLVNLTLKDLKRTNLDVRLKISIEGQGIKMITKDDFIPKIPISLLPGVPELVYGDFLEEYLVPEHMNFSGITKKQFLKTGRLPEGVYKFKVEVFEARRKEKVSNTGTTMAWMILNEPPVITTPTNNKVVKASDPASIFFNWLPRHMNSQNALSDVEYEFTLVEIWPVNQSVEEAIRSKEPLLKTIFRNTSFVYDAQYPALEPGRKYACRVRAFSNDQKEMFKNKGYSPVVSFVFGQECKPPLMVDVDPSLGGSAQLSIVPQNNHNSFTIQLRDVAGEKWYSQESNLPDFELKQLKPGATYQYKVQAQCESLESDFTPIKQFSLSKEQEKVACGQSVEVHEIDGSPALNKLQEGDMINAGGFKVLVKKVSGGGGTFTGSGVVRISMFGNIELRTVFENINVNESYQLTGGEIRVVGSDIYALGGDIRDQSDGFFDNEIWDAVDDAIEDAEKIVNNISDLQKNFGDNNLNDELEEAKKTIERGRDLLALDKSSKGAELIKEGADKVAQILDKVNSGDYQITTNGIQFLAHDNQSYGFDSHEEGLSEEEKKAYYAYYETIQLGDSTESYFLKPWKSITSNGNDQVKVKIDLNSEMKADTVHFMNSMGTEVAAQKQGDAYQLNLRGSFHEDVQELTAFYTVKDDSTKKTKKVLLGALNVISYNQIDKHLVLVPVNGNQTIVPQGQLKKYLNDAYSSANVRWTVSQHAGVQVEYSDDMSQGLDDGESKMLSNYTKEMNKVIKALKRSGDYDRSKTYIFLVDKAKTAGKAGFMPKKRRWGFVFTDVHKRNPGNYIHALCRTIAHEVAHGEFRLSHPFQDFPSIPQKSTQNLMDYADGNQLRKYQWDDIHNLRDVKLWGQEEEGNAFVIGETSLENIVRAVRNVKCAKENNAETANLYFGNYSYSIEIKDLVTAFNWAGSDVSDEKIKFYISNDGEINLDYFEDEFDVKDIQYDDIKKQVVLKGKECSLFVQPYDDYSDKKVEIYSFIKTIFNGSISIKEPTSIEINGMELDKLRYLSVCQLGLLNDTKRKETLKSISEQIAISAKDEKLVLNLLRTTKAKSIIYSLLQDGKVSIDLYKGMNTYKQEFTFLFNWICEDAWSDTEKQGSKRLFLGTDGKGNRFQLSENDWMMGDCLDEKEVRVWNLEDLGGNNKKSNKFTSAPAAPIRIAYFDGNTQIVSTLMVDYMRSQENKEEWTQAFFDYLTGVGLTSAGRLLVVKSTPKIIRFLAVIEFGKTNVDIAFKDEALKKTLKDNGHEWFVDNWQTISSAIDVATFGSEVLVNFAKNGDDLSGLLRENGNVKAADEIDDITAEAKVLQGNIPNPVTKYPVDGFREIANGWTGVKITRFKTADDFLKKYKPNSTSADISKIDDELRGIDFDKPVTPGTASEGDFIYSWVYPKRGTQDVFDQNNVGQYFTYDKNLTPEVLGIPKGNRVLRKFKVTEEMEYLKSTAADIKWRDNATVYTGGGDQFYIPDAKSMSNLILVE